MEKKDIILPQLLQRYDQLKYITNERSIKYLLGIAIKNKETNLYELPESSYERVQQLVIKHLMLYLFIKAFQFV